MGEAENLEKAWFVGGYWGRGETPNSGVVVNVDGYNRKSYSLLPDHNGNNVRLIRTQILYQPEHSTRRASFVTRSRKSS